MIDRAADDDARWAEALESLEHGPTAAVRARVRRLRLVVVGITLVVLVPVLLIPFLLPDRPDRPASDEPATGLEVAGLVVMAGAVLLQITALVLMFRANRGRWASPLVALDRRQQRQLRDHVRGVGPLPPERVPLARYLAESTLRQRPLPLIFLGSALLWVGMALGTPSWWRTAMAAAFVALTLLGWVLVRREVRRARRFLDQHPASADPA